jgi:endonuclease III
VILSAQCTDERVNQVTPNLFLRYPNLDSFCEAKTGELEDLIFSTGFYKNKAKSIIGFCNKLKNDFGGQIPKNLSDLIKLPGIGRKTANVLLNELYNISEGIVVDTHVKRISNLLKLTDKEDPEKIELDLMKIIPKEYWLNISLYFIFLGREFCKAKRKDCKNCFLNQDCPSVEPL